uniref:Uncharacterized protein n=1 Tax=Fundulus heteroclitus TaxID=8078 RepID=A0A3Q2PMY4_FUNHE
MWPSWRPIGSVRLNSCRPTLLEARSVRVVVVSFGRAEGAQLWLQETGCTFEMLLDSQRQVYRSFGLGSSFSRVLKFGCLMRFSEYSVADRDFPDFPYRLLEDIYQVPRALMAVLKLSQVYLH